MAENHHGITRYNYTLNNPLKYTDPLGLDTLGINSTAKAKAGDQIEVSKGQYVTASIDEVVVTGKKTEDSKKGGSEFGTASFAGGGLAGDWGTALLEPSPFGEVVMVGVTLYVAYKAITATPTQGFGDPSSWTTTHLPPSQNPINNPPNGFDPKNPPPGWTGPVKWAGAGALGYKLYKNYQKAFSEQPVAPQDNTKVVRPWKPNSPPLVP
jgi:hypothetical protein